MAACMPITNCHRSYVLGIRSSIASKSKKDASGFHLVLNPYVTAEWRLFGFCAGLSFADFAFPLPLPNFSLRIGSTDVFYYSLHWFDSWPIYSGGGFLRFGVGLEVSPSTSLWIGAGSMPYKKLGLLVLLEQKLTEAYLKGVEAN